MLDTKAEIMYDSHSQKETGTHSILVPLWRIDEAPLWSSCFYDDCMAHVTDCTYSSHRVWPLSFKIVPSTVWIYASSRKIVLALIELGISFESSDSTFTKFDMTKYCSRLQTCSVFDGLLKHGLHGLNARSIIVLFVNLLVRLPCLSPLFQP